MGISFNDDEIFQEPQGSLHELIISPLHDEYKKLPPQGKFATGAVVGFAGSRCALKSAVKVLRVGGAAFVVTEILHTTGALDTSRWPLEHHSALQAVQDSIMRAVKDCRSCLRCHLDPDNLRGMISNCVEKDKPGSAGFAAGVLAGLML